MQRSVVVLAGCLVAGLLAVACFVASVLHAPTPMKYVKKLSWTVQLPCGSVPLALRERLSLRDAKIAVGKLGDFEVVSEKGAVLSEEDWSECLKGDQPQATCLRVRPVSLNTTCPATVEKPRPYGPYMEKALRRPPCVDWNTFDDSDELHCTRRWRPGDGPCGAIPAEWEPRMRPHTNVSFSFDQMVMFLVCPSADITEQLPQHFDGWLHDFALDLVARRERLDVVVVTDAVNPSAVAGLLRSAKQALSSINAWVSPIRKGYGISYTMHTVTYVNNTWTKDMLATVIFDSLKFLVKTFPRKNYIFKIDPDTLVFQRALRQVMNVFYRKMNPRFPWLVGAPLSGGTFYWPSKLSCCCRIDEDFCYPPGGHGYILSRPAARIIAENAETCLQSLPDGYWEDYAVGGCFFHMTTTPIINCGCFGCYPVASQSSWNPQTLNVPGSYVTIHGKIFGDLADIYRTLKATNFSRWNWCI